MRNYNLKITRFDDVFAKKATLSEISWNDLCNQVENPQVYYQKKSMPLIKMATFGDIRTDQDSLRHDSNLLKVYGIEGDYDAEQVPMAEAAKLLEKRGITAVLFTSPSATPQKPRYRILAPFSRAYEPEERNHFAGLLNAALGGILATESFTLSQSFYYGKANTYYEVIRVEGEPIDFKDGQWEPAFPAPRQINSNGQKAPIQDRIETAIQSIYNNDAYYQPALSLTALYFNSGMSREASKATVKAIMSQHPNPNKDIKKYIADVDGFLASQDFKDQEEKKTFVVPLVKFSKDKNGKILPTQANLIKLLETYQLRYDEFRAAYMGVFDGVMRVITEEDYTRIQFHSEQLGFGKVSTAMVRENVLMICMNNSFDSAIEWGNGLVWDGVERCQDLLVKYFGAEQSAYVDAASMYIASAMGGRLMEPGCKADAAIVLVGDQGAGKTVSINALAPMQDTFVEISLHSRDTDLSRHLRGKLIGELAELRGLKSKESEDIKAWMSRTTEEWVPKYMEFTKTFKRRLTFWGSTNDSQFLNDVTGNRRWLPIKVKKPHPELIKRDVEQIWAEAIYIYKNYGVLWQAVQELAEEARQEHFDEDPFVDEVRSFLNLKSAVEKFTPKEIWAGTNKFAGEFDTRANNQVKRAMSVLGWEFKPLWIGNKTVRGFVRKNKNV
jgi:hypothetical protein